MDHQPYARTDIRLPILSGLAILFFAMSIVLLLSDSARNSIRTGVGLAPNALQPDPSQSKEEQDRRQLMEVAAALGIAVDTHNLASAVKGVVAERQGIRAKHDALTAQHADLQRSKVELENRTKAAARKLSQDLTQRLAKTSLRQVASAPAKASPGIGLFMVAGFTALDVYEACEMFKSINDLNYQIGIEQENADKVCGIKPPTQDDLARQITHNWRAAYQSAAAAANQSGWMVSLSPPSIDWAQIRGPVCAVANVPLVCH